MNHARRVHSRGAVAALLLLAACASNRVAYRYQIDGALNPNVGGGVENLLQMKSFLLPEEAASQFRAADYDQLALAESGGGFGVVSPLHVLQVPRTDAERRGELVAGEKNERTRFLGVIANFNQKAGEGWKALIALEDLPGKVLWLKGHELVFDQPPRAGSN